MHDVVCWVIMRPAPTTDGRPLARRSANAVEKVTQAGRIAQALEQAQAEAAARQAILRQSTQFSVAKKLGKPLKRIHMVKILQFAFAGYLAFLAVIVKLFSPSLFWMFFATLGSVPIGIGMSFLFHQNRVNKTETRDKVWCSRAALRRCLSHHLVAFPGRVDSPLCGIVGEGADEI